MGTFRIGYYLPSDAPLIQSAITPFLNTIEEIDKGRWSLEGCLSDIACGDLIPWMVWEDDHVLAVITTRICQAKIKFLIIEDVAGSRVEEWIDQAHSAIETLAKSLDCKQITFGGRIGWERYFKRFGFVKSRIEGYKNI